MLERLERRLYLDKLSRRDWLLLTVGAVVALGVLAGVVAIQQAQKVPLKPKSTRLTTTWLPKTVQRWEGPIDEMAKRYNIDPDLLAIVMTMESGGAAKVESEAGAKGLMQITGPTAQDI